MQKQNNINQKGNILPIIAIAVLLLIVGAGAYYFGTIRSAKIPDQESFKAAMNQAINHPSFIPSPAIFQMNIPDDFPVYPGATFVKKETSPSCPEGVTHSGGSLSCNSIIYSWISNDSGYQVDTWYKSKQFGWDCNGGGTGEYSGKDDFYARTDCTKDNIFVILYLNTAVGQQTEIKIEIPDDNWIKSSNKIAQ